MGISDSRAISITQGPLEDGGDANHCADEVGQEYFVRVKHGAYPGPLEDAVQGIEENRIIWRASPEIVIL